MRKKLTTILALLALVAGLQFIMAPQSSLIGQTYQILVRRGLAADLPTLAAGEPGFATDTRKLYVGSSVGNVEITGPHVTPEQYGAKGDGTTDDRTAINSAFSAVNAGGGGIVIFGQGKTYYVSSNVSPTVAAGRRVLVSGYGARLLYGDGLSTGMSMFYIDCAGEIIVEGLELDGDLPSVSQITAISATEASVGVTIRDCYIHEFTGHGVYRLGDHAKVLYNNIDKCGLNGIDNGGDNYQIIEGNKITESGYQGIDIDQQGLTRSAPRYCRVVNNKIIGWGKAGVANTAGITLGGDEAETSYSGLAGWNVAIDNYVEYIKYDEAGKWGMVVSGQNCTIANNTIKSSTADLMTYGIIFGVYGENHVVTGNNIADCTYGMLNATTVASALANRHFSITDNFVEGCSYGVVINGTSDMTIAGNHIDVSDYGIYVKNLDNSSVAGNKVNISTSSVSPFGIAAEAVTGCSFTGNIVEVTSTAVTPTLPTAFIVDTGDGQTSVIGNALINKTAAAGYGGYFITFSGYAGNNTLYANTATAVATSPNGSGDANYDLANNLYTGFSGNTIWTKAVQEQSVNTTDSPTFSGFNIVGGTGTTKVFSHQADALADDGTVTLPDATSGMVLVSCNAEAGMWLVQADGTCTKISGSTNTANTDADGSLCVYDGGTGGIVKNRLGATGEIRIVYYYN